MVKKVLTSLMTIGLVIGVMFGGANVAAGQTASTEVNDASGGPIGSTAWGKQLGITDLTTLSEIRALSPQHKRELDKLLADPKLMYERLRDGGSDVTMLAEGDSISNPAVSNMASRTSSPSGQLLKPLTIYNVHAWKAANINIFGVTVFSLRMDAYYQTDGTNVTKVKWCDTSHRNFLPPNVVDDGTCHIDKQGNVAYVTADWNISIVTSWLGLGSYTKRGEYWINGSTGIYSWSLYNI